LELHCLTLVETILSVTQKANLKGNIIIAHMEQSDVFSFLSKKLGFPQDSSITRKIVSSNFCLFTNKLVKTAQHNISGVRKTKLLEGLMGVVFFLYF
jgi:hypothetical protein